MNTSNTITTIGSLLGALIAIVGFVLYIRVHPRKDTFLRVIRRVNFLLFISMAIVVIGVVLSTLDTGGFSISHLPMLWVLPSTGFILVFIIGQIIYFLWFPASPLRDQPAPQPLSDEDFERAYREQISQDIHLNTIQIMGMGEPLEIIDVYIPRKFGESSPDVDVPKENQSNDLTSDNLNNPDQLLEKAEARLKLWHQRAIDTTTAINDRNCVIVGDPGIGKTTFLKYLGSQEAKKSNGEAGKLPLYVDLNAFAIAMFTGEGHVDREKFNKNSDKGKYLLEFIARRDSAKYTLDFRDTFKCIQRKLEKGCGILLLLDSLDETLVGESAEEASECYKDTCKIITTLAKNRNAQIIVTSRNAIYDKYPVLGKEFNKLYLSGFSPEERDKFIKNWFTKRSELSGHERENVLLVRLRQSRRLRLIVTNPLFLSILALVYDPLSDEILERHAELYKQCVDALLYKWDSSRGVTRQHEFTRSNEEELLKEIAWYFSEKGAHIFREDVLQGVIKKFLSSKNLIPKKAGETLEETIAKKAKETLEEITTQYGLLKKVGQDYVFSHLIFQEYFVAQRAEDEQEDGLKTLLAHVGDAWWEEIIYLYTAYTSHVQTLLEALEDDIFHTNLLRIGASIAATNPANWTSHSHNVITSLFNVLKKTPYKLLRDQVATTLAYIGGPVNEQLLMILSPADSTEGIKMRSEITDLEEVRSSVIEALGKYGEQQVADKLADMLSNPDVDLPVRRDIADALGKLGYGSVVPTLKGLLSNKRVDVAKGQFFISEVDVGLRKSISDALGKLGDASVVPDLLDLLANPKLDSDIGKSIARTLSELEASSAAPDLLTLLSNGKTNIDVRQEIITTLYRLDKNRVGTTQHFRHLLEEALIEWSVRARMIIVLGMWGERDMLAKAVQLFTDKIHWTIRNALVDFLQEVNAHPLVPALVPLLVDEGIDEDIRTHLAQVLGSLSRQSSERRNIARELSKYMVDMSINSRVRGSIGRAIGEMGESNVIQDILGLLANDKVEPEVLELCTVLIIKYHNAPEIVENIKEILLKHEQKNMAIILGILGEQSVLASLEKLVEDPELDIGKREDLIEALSTIRDQQERLEYEQGNSAIKLAILGNKSILASLEDPELDIGKREDLIEALSTIGDDSTEKRLREKPFDQIKENIRQNILEVLKRLAKDKETCKILSKYLVSKSNIADDIYNTLHIISAKHGFRVFQLEQITGSTIERIEVGQWRYKLVSKPYDLLPSSRK